MIHSKSVSVKSNIINNNKINTFWPVSYESYGPNGKYIMKNIHFKDELFL